MCVKRDYDLARLLGRLATHFITIDRARLSRTIMLLFGAVCTGALVQRAPLFTSHLPSPLLGSRRADVCAMAYSVDDPISVGAALPNIAVEVMEDYDAAGAGSPGVTKPIGKSSAAARASSSACLVPTHRRATTCTSLGIIMRRRASAAWASTRSRSSPQMTASSTRSGRNRWRNAWVSRRARRRL